MKNENTYDPTKYIRGGDIIQTEKNNEKAKVDNKPRSRSTLNDRSQGNSTNKTKEVNEFDQIENKFSYDRKNSIYSVKQNVLETQQPNQTEMNENINNPYSQINLNNVSYAKNKYQQQPTTKRSNTSNMNNQNNNKNQNNFDFSNHQNNQMNNQFDFLQASNNNNVNNRNMNPVNNYPNFNFNQNNTNNNNINNSSINSNYNQGINYNPNANQNNHNKINNFDFGLIDFTNTNNLQQNINNANNAINFYQNNQSQIHTYGNQAINMNNNLNNVGIATGIPTTNFNFPKNNNEKPINNKNDDIFQDFFK